MHQGERDRLHRDAHDRGAAAAAVVGRAEKGVVVAAAVGEGAAVRGKNSLAGVPIATSPGFNMAMELDYAVQAGLKQPRGDQGRYGQWAPLRLELRRRRRAS